MVKTVSLVKNAVGCIDVKGSTLPGKPTCLGLPVNRKLPTLTAIVKDYKCCHRKKAKMELRVFERYTSFEVVLEKAGNARTPCGKKYPHQQRISPSVLKKATQSIITFKKDIKKSDSFEDLYKKISAITESIIGIGPLYIYDTALRIGAYLKKRPKVIYLHCGALVGASKLGLVTRRKTLCKEELPQALRCLQPYEIEDVLCIYEKYLSKK